MTINGSEPIESYFAGDASPLIPDGQYTVQCLKIDKGFSHRGALKMFLVFKIIDGSHMGKELFMAMNLIDSRTGKPFKKVPRGSKYYQNWVIANYGKIPSRNDRMSPSIFKDGIFLAVVRTVMPLFPDGTKKPDCFWYSVVDFLKKRLQ